MRFKTDSRKPMMPELIASSNQSRPTLTKVHLNAEAGMVEVTDSYMLARFPVELDEGDTSGPIPVEALKASRKPPLKGLPTSIRASGDTVDVHHGFGEDASAPYLTLPRETADYTFPDCARLFPENTAEFEIGVDAAALAKLAKAMGTDHVRLRFTASKDDDHAPSNLRPIVVEPLKVSGDPPTGLLMPFRAQ